MGRMVPVILGNLHKASQYSPGDEMHELALEDVGALTGGLVSIPLFPVWVAQIWNSQAISSKP